MGDKFRPEDYRRMARELRAIGITTPDPKQAADALKIAEDYERIALAVEVELSAKADLNNGPRQPRSGKGVPQC